MYYANLSKNILFYSLIKQLKGTLFSRHPFVHKTTCKKLPLYSQCLQKVYVRKAYSQNIPHER